MKALYALVGISKQSHLKYQKRQQKLEDQSLLLFPIIDEWRKRHPSMSLKNLYFRINPEFIGRDKFIVFGTAYGFEAISNIKPCKTTIYTGTSKIPNLLIDTIVYDHLLAPSAQAPFAGLWSFLFLIPFVLLVAYLFDDEGSICKASDRHSFC